MSKTLIMKKELADLVGDRRDRIIVTTNGTFDVLHIGHVRTLFQARALGDALIVLINSDESVRRFKGPSRPIVSAADRAEMLTALKPVDYALIFEENKPLELLKTIQPDIHVKGGSYIKDRVAEEEALVQSWGGKLVCLRLEEGYSTSAIIEKIIKSAK